MTNAGNTTDGSSRDAKAGSTTQPIKRADPRDEHDQPGDDGDQRGVRDAEQQRTDADDRAVDRPDQQPAADEAAEARRRSRARARSGPGRCSTAGSAAASRSSETWPIARPTEMITAGDERAHEHDRVADGRLRGVREMRRILREEPLDCVTMVSPLGRLTPRKSTSGASAVWTWARICGRFATNDVAAWMIATAALVMTANATTAVTT
jgi:hypothetical protein